MTDTLVLGSFDSLWHYGLPSSPRHPPPPPPPLTSTSLPSDLTHSSCFSLPSNTMTVSLEGSLRSLFALLDEDNNGRLSLREIHSLLARLGFRSPSQDENDLLCVIQSILQHQHTSSSHDLPSLDFPQFAQLYCSLFASREAPQAGDDDLDDELLDAFRVYDIDRDGFISAIELAAVLIDLKLLPAIDSHHRGVEAHVARCQSYIDCVDLDGNGMVDVEEFKAMMMTSRHSCSSGIPLFAH